MLVKLTCCDSVLPSHSYQVSTALPAVSTAQGGSTFPYTEPSGPVRATELTDAEPVVEAFSANCPVVVRAVAMV